MPWARILISIGFLLASCGETKKSSSDSGAGSSDVSLAGKDEVACIAQMKFYDLTTKICEPYIDYLKDCTKDLLTTKLANDPAKAKLSELDPYLSQKFEIYSCGVAKEGIYVILIQRKSAGEPGGIAIVKKSFIYGSSDDLQQKGGTTTNKETSLSSYRKSDCLPLKAADSSIQSFVVRTLNVQPSMDITFGIQYFDKTDTKCTGPIQEFNEIKGKYTLGAVVATPVGSREFNWTVTSVKTTAWSTSIIADHNLHNYCGQNDWQASLAKDVTTQPSCTIGRNFVPGVFTIIKYDGGATPTTMQIGNIEADPASAVSAATRSTALADYILK